MLILFRVECLKDLIIFTSIKLTIYLNVMKIIAKKIQKKK